VDSRDRRATIGEPWRPAWFAVVLVLLVLVYAPTVSWLWGRWTMSIWHNAHGMFIPPLAAWLAWGELKRLRDLPRQSSAWGFALVVPALLVHAFDTALNTQLASAASIVLLLPGLSLLFLGPARTLAIGFPLALMAFMLPIPLALTSRLHLALRHLATAATAAVVPWLGVRVFAEDTTLHIANATLEVADACSGFSTLYASVVMALLTAYFCRSWARRVLVLVASVPIAIAANVLRVVLLVLIVYWQGTDVLATSLHEISGLFTFALALPVISWIGTDRKPKQGAA
jgi:exosortase